MHTQIFRLCGKSHSLLDDPRITKSRKFLLSAEIFGSLFNKQCRSRSDCSYRSSLNGSTLFASLLMLNNKQTLSIVVILLAF